PLARLEQRLERGRNLALVVRDRRLPYRDRRRITAVRRDLDVAVRDLRERGDVVGQAIERPAERGAPLERRRRDTVEEDLPEIPVGIDPHAREAVAALRAAERTAIIDRALQNERRAI